MQNKKEKEKREWYVVTKLESRRRKRVDADCGELL